MYREKVRAPWWMWMLAFFAASSVGLAIGAAFGEYSDIIATAVTFILLGIGIVRSTITITVDEDFLRVNDAKLPRRFVGEVTALDAKAAREIRGPKADPAAFLVMRGWIPTAVVVANTDTDDPVPYWYISSRTPTKLAQALNQSRSS